MGLSEADANKWPPLLEQIATARLGTSMPSPSTSVDDRPLVRQIHQRQKLLSEDEIEQLIAAYRAGSTVYQLAKQFGCHRTTVSGCLKASGVQMRRTPLSHEQIEEAVRLYEAGLSCTKIGHKVGCSPDTVRSHLRQRGVVMRPASHRQESDVMVNRFTSS